MLDIVPVIMAGIIGIYGLVVSVLISDGLKQEMALYTGFIQLGAGLSVGLAGLAAGYVYLPAIASWVLRLAANFAFLQLRNRYRRRRGCSRHSSTTPTLCWHDPDPHFRRSLGSLWLDCSPAHELQGHNGCQMQVNTLIMPEFLGECKEHLAPHSTVVKLQPYHHLQTPCMKTKETIAGER